MTILKFSHKYLRQVGAFSDLINHRRVVAFSGLINHWRIGGKLLIFLFFIYLFIYFYLFFILFIYLFIYYFFFKDVVFMRTLCFDNMCTLWPKIRQIVSPGHLMNILWRHYVLGIKYLVLAFFKAITTKIYHQSIIENVSKSEENLGSSR